VFLHGRLFCFPAALYHRETVSLRPFVFETVHDGYYNWCCSVTSCRNSTIHSNRDLSGCPDGSYGLVFERPVESTGPDQNIGIFYRNLPQDRLP